MASFNKVILLGNLTRDPEVRYRRRSLRPRLAVNRFYPDAGSGSYVDVVLWARLAEIAGEYLRTTGFHRGRLQMDTWDDKQTGQKRTKLRVVGETMQLLGSRPAGGTSAPAEAGEEDKPARSSGKPTAPPKPSSAEPDDDEIPF
jgi:single-strand DNA-binding protein